MTEQTYKYHAFLSHNSAQKDWTRKLAKSLRDEGLKIFFDEDSIELGEDIIVAIENGLRNSRHVLLVLSPEAIMSKWVALELSTSLHRDPNAAERSLIPVLRKQCEIPLTIAMIKYLDATSDDLDRQISQLVKAIDKDTIKLTLPAKLPDKPIISQLPEEVVAHPGGTLSPSSQVYIERDVDKTVQNALNKGNQIVVVWGPRQVGKSSLVVRTLSEAKNKGIKTSLVDFSGIGGDDLTQLSYGISCEIAKSLEINMPAADNYLSSIIGPLSALRTFLSSISVPTIIAFDEVDYLLRIDKFGSFFSFIRAFHANQVMENSPVSLIISSFLEPSEFISNNMVSPFNVGVSIRLPNFNHDEVHQLFKAYKINLDDESFQLLYQFVGGQPFLVHKVAYLLKDGISVAEILNNARADDYFGMHLSMVSSYAKFSSKAQDGIKKILSGKKVVESDVTELFNRGIVEWCNGVPKFSSQLYEQYFREIISGGG